MAGVDECSEDDDCRSHGGTAMAPIQPTEDLDPGEERGTIGRRKAVRYLVPVAVAGLTAATITLVPALADSGDPDLPKITAQQLVTKLAASDVQTVSGSV